MTQRFPSNGHTAMEYVRLWPFDRKGYTVGESVRLSGYQPMVANLKRVKAVLI
jgi:hypothetical protein